MKAWRLEVKSRLTTMAVSLAQQTAVGTSGGSRIF